MSLVQDRMYSWQNRNENIAPLTDEQLDLIYDISEIVNGESVESHIDVTGRTECPVLRYQLAYLEFDTIETSHDFFVWYAEMEEELGRESGVHCIEYRDRLFQQRRNTLGLMGDANSALQDMYELSVAYSDVSAKTNSLNELSEQLLIDQTRLQSISLEINKRLSYFTCLTQLSQALSLPALSPSGAGFFDMLRRIDGCIEYMTANSNYRESYGHLIKYKQTLYNVMFLIRCHVQQVFTSAAEQASAPEAGPPSAQSLPVVNTDLTFSLYYGKFQSAAAKVKAVIEQVEIRASESKEYSQLLSECQSAYLSQRMNLMNGAIADTVSQLVDNHKRDNGALFRAGCTFMHHVCQDETQLYGHFFKDASVHLGSYLERLCTHLYDNLRPLIVHINHMETLAELCGILRAEMATDLESSDRDADAEAFTRVLWQLLQDVQERLVFRTHVYLHSDLLQYRPSAGDLAYPDKLQMMESIAQNVSQNDDGHRSRTGNSPADLHGMWYPTVKRTLVCLSRLYRCVDRPIFQGLSQEALTICVQTVINASQVISRNKSPIDGELFQIKHLLILREQIAPFQVDFTVKEMSLDFSKVKTAAFSLLQKRSQLFALNANNALLEFLLEGTPQVKEQLLDSRKQVDKQLKHSCEEFIKYCTALLVGPMSGFLEKAQHLLKMSEQHTIVELKGQSFADPEAIGSIISQVQRNIKSRLAAIQKSMQLYLANKETEFILFRPIKNNVVSSFVQLEQVLNMASYSPEQLLVVACPTAEQVSVLLSSASLLASSASTPIQQQQLLSTFNP